MKNLKELKGIKVLSKNEQKAITGGFIYCNEQWPCPGTRICINNTCLYA